ncbi:AfsR/SARP family transcriptional regulator [Nocardia sp. NPDC051570]|uniref:AfsR/SARP family transcriptional regulator n=1 Tax=Nocardia sp. NPDC051570 TaxID=3364324 RepID=UPI0037969B5C
MLKFAMLGEVRAWRGEHRLELGPKQRRAVLAALLLRPGRSATLPDLIADVWGKRPPPSAVGAVRNHVLHLRRVLEPERENGMPPAVLVGFGGGYALRVPPGSVDVELVQRYAAEAGQAVDLASARDRLDAALALWEGTPLAGLPGPHAERVRAQLCEFRLALTEQRLVADLRLGRPGEVIAELRPLIAEYPLREQIRKLLMIALYRAGRQAEALEVFADTRRILVDRLGIEPGPRLTELQQRILRGEAVDDDCAHDVDDNEVGDALPGGSLGAGIVGSGDVGALKPGDGGGESGSGEPGLEGWAAVLGTRVSAGWGLPPAQLPADIADFTGRGEVVRRLVERLGEAGAAVPVCAITGMGGVGKSTVAVHVAHRVRHRFPDGQLHVDLHGFERPGGTSAGDILGDFLRALGMPEGEIAPTPQQRAAQFRGRLDGRRVLVVLDNARDGDQVLPLIPATPGSAVLITSRAALPQLPGVLAVRLDEMDTEEAVALLTRIVGARRVAAEPAATAAVVQACGRLPLAVRIVGSRLASRPRWDITAIAERLADERQRLGLLRTGELTVEAVFRLGYDHLEPAQAKAFRMLAVPEAEDLPLAGVAAMLESGDAEAEALCESLVDLSLLDATAIGRYRYHDLLRLFAREVAPADDADALARLLDFYLATMKNVVVVCNPGTRLPEHLRPTVVAGLSFRDGIDAQSWLNAERLNLIALLRQAARLGGDALALCADLAWAMAELIECGPNAQEHVRALEELLQAALQVGDRGLECRVRAALGAVLTYALARMRTGRDHQRIALSLGTDSADAARLTAFAAQLLAASTRMGTEVAASLAHAERAIRLARRVDDPAIEGACLIHAAKSLSDAGRFDEAVARAEQGLALARRIGNHALTGMATHELGAALAFRGEYDRAVELCTRAVESARLSGSRLRVGFALARLAQVVMLAGRLEQAESVAAAGVDAVTEAAGPLHRARVQVLHGVVLLALGRTDQAQRAFRSAAEIFVALEDAHLVHERLNEAMEAPVVEILRVHLDAVLAEKDGPRQFSVISTSSTALTCVDG